MSVKQFPEPSPKRYPYGTNSASARSIRTIGQGVYEVNVSGSTTFAASAEGLSFLSPSGFKIPVALNDGEGVVSLPWEASSSVIAASMVMPTVIEMDRISYDIADAPTGAAASFDPLYSGSFIFDATLPGDAASVTLYYPNQSRTTVASLPASIESVDYDFDESFDTGSWGYALTYVDTNGITSAADSGSLVFPVPTGFYATGGTIVSDGGYRYHKFTSSGTLTVLKSGSFEYLAIGGGGGGASKPTGGGGGGGGAGEFQLGTASVSTGSITITIGGGGGNPGSSTLIGTAASVVGGDGGSGNDGGTSGNGYSGYTGYAQYNSFGGGGGGAVQAATDRNGAIGAISASAWATATSTGVSERYAAGAGGAYGAGGTGGGGNGAAGSTAGSGGTANTGSGGGGAYNVGPYGGGSGLVLIRYIP